MKEKVWQDTYIGRFVDIVYGMPRRKNLLLQCAWRGGMECAVSQPQLRGHFSVGQVPVPAVVAQGSQAFAALGSAGDEAGPRPGNGELVLERAHLRMDFLRRSAFRRNHLEVWVRRRPFGFGFRRSPWLFWLGNQGGGLLRRR